MWCNICRDEGSSHPIIMYALNMVLQCWSQLTCQAPGCPPVPGLQWKVTLVLSEIYWSAVPSPHHHHWPGQSTASSRLAPSGHSLHFTNHIGCIGNFSCICSTEFGFHCDTDMHSIDTAIRWPTRVHIPVHLINLSLLIFAIISCAAPPIAPLPADRMAARSETTHW